MRNTDPVTKVAVAAALTSFAALNLFAGRANAAAGIAKQSNPSLQGGEQNVLIAQIQQDYLRGGINVGPGFFADPRFLPTQTRLIQNLASPTDKAAQLEELAFKLGYVTSASDQGLLWFNGRDANGNPASGGPSLIYPSLDCKVDGNNPRIVAAAQKAIAAIDNLPGKGQTTDQYRATLQTFVDQSACKTSPTPTPANPTSVNSVTADGGKGGDGGDVDNKNNNAVKTGDTVLSTSTSTNIEYKPPFIPASPANSGSSGQPVCPNIFTISVNGNSYSMGSMPQTESFNISIPNIAGVVAGGGFGSTSTSCLSPAKKETTDDMSKRSWDLFEQVVKDGLGLPSTLQK